MPTSVKVHDGFVLALAVIALVAAGALIAPDVPERYGPTREGLIELTDQVVRAKAAGALRLLALTAGIALLALGHARLPRGPGRSLFLLSGLSAMGLWWLAALVRLTFSDADFPFEDQEAGVALFDALARLADTAALLPAGLAIAGFGLAPAEGTADGGVPDGPDGGPNYGWSSGYATVGGVVALCGITVALSLRSDGQSVDTTVVRPGAGAAIAGSILVLLAGLAIGERLAELGRGAVAGGGHETMAYGFADWDDQRRQALSLLLRSAGVAHAWQGEDLVVARTSEPTVDGLVEQIEATEGESGP